MKIKSNPKNKTLLAANKCRVSHDGKTYLIHACTLGPLILANAEPFPQGGELINLFDKTVLARALRATVEAHLYRS